MTITVKLALLSSNWYFMSKLENAKILKNAFSIFKSSAHNGSYALKLNSYVKDIPMKQVPLQTNLGITVQSTELQCSWYRKDTTWVSYY